MTPSSVAVVNEAALTVQGWWSMLAYVGDGYLTMKSALFCEEGRVCLCGLRTDRYRYECCTSETC
ncbi:MAG TPA: hypothetical protein VIC30_13860 [Orrella sp.]